MRVQGGGEAMNALPFFRRYEYCSRCRRHFRTVLPDEDVEHRQNLAVVGHQRLPDEALPVRPLVARNQCLQNLQHFHDHRLLSRVQRSCAHATAPAPAVNLIEVDRRRKTVKAGERIKGRVLWLYGKVR